MAENYRKQRSVINRAVLIEGLLLLTISLVSLVESVRLITYKNPRVIYDLLGPGYYLLFVSMGLFITSVVYVFHHVRKGHPTADEKTSREMRGRLIPAFSRCMRTLSHSYGYHWIRNSHFRLFYAHV